MVELVVRAQCGQRPGANGVGEEDLRGAVDPSLGVAQLAPVRRDVAPEPDGGAFQCNRSETS